MRAKRAKKLSFDVGSQNFYFSDPKAVVCQKILFRQYKQDFTNSWKIGMQQQVALNNKDKMENAREIFVF